MEARNTRHPRKYLNFLFQVFKLITLAVIAISVFFALNQRNFVNYFPIKTVRIYGINRITQTEMHDELLPLVNQGFFAIDVDYIHDRLLQLPWVSDLYVRRIWPDQVEVSLIEKNPIARWNDEALLSQGGELFTPKQETYPLNLPAFVGPSGQQMEMLKYFADMNRLLLPLHAKISYLELTPFLTWKLRLDNGITMQIGHKDILTRLGHFVKVYPKIIGNHVADVDCIDLRYPNGVAVRWKSTKDDPLTIVGRR
jgi:cell division protein FtsQ